MQRTEWFDRTFPPIDDNGIMPCIIERLEYTPLRLKHKIEGMGGHLAVAVGGQWSIQKEIGHLIDLEPLWYNRMLQIIDGAPDLMAADLTNRKTHETDYDSQEALNLIRILDEHRQRTVGLLRNTTDKDLEKSSRHPRLGTPMKLVDLAFFVAEHDDHHLAQITFLSSNK